ncbi:MAG: ABC transporter substrate-binding protein [Actinomycetota bacterium]|nr:ABC transporter substrate-binding protein [Actinomycetota bacterium]
MHDERVPSIGRRQFLANAAKIGALAAFPGLLAACGEDEPTATTGPVGTTGPTAAPATTGAAPSTSVAAAGPLRVGLLVPLSGNLGALGPELQLGFEVYLEQQGGSLGGRPVEVVVEDTEGVPEAGVRGAQRLLLEESVDVVTGILNSAVALGVRDIFHEAQVPLIISNAAANAITREALSPYIFRSAFSNYQPSWAMGTWLAENVADAQVLVTAADYAAGTEMLAGFRAGLEEAGGTVVGEVLAPLGTADFQPFLSGMQDSGATAVFAFYPGADAIAFVTQYAEFGLQDSLPLYGTVGLTDPEQIRMAQGAAAHGIRAATTYSAQLDNELNGAFVEAYTARSGGLAPSPFAVQAHNGAQLLDVALAKLDGNTDDVEALVDALETAGQFETPSGSFEMDPATHNPIRPFYLVEVVPAGEGSVHEVVEDLGLIADPG